MDFLALVKEKMKLVEIDEELLKRPVNEGFSGGEKKRNEIFQMAVLEPTLAILDETDSGLDIDALRIVAAGVNALRAAGARDDRGHALPAAARTTSCPTSCTCSLDGRIVRSGGKELALELEEKGYDWLEKEPARAPPAAHGHREAVDRTLRATLVARLRCGAARASRQSSRGRRGWLGDCAVARRSDRACRGARRSRRRAADRRVRRYTNVGARSRRSTPPRGAASWCSSTAASRRAVAASSAGRARRAASPRRSQRSRTWSEPHLGRGRRQRGERLRRLNTALLDDGACRRRSRAARSLESPIHLLFVSTEPARTTPSVALPRAA